jgi:hypothetical protein
MEMMLAVISMLGDGVLERRRNLRVAVLEGNGSWVPFLLWRLLVGRGAPAATTRP